MDDQCKGYKSADSRQPIAVSIYSSSGYQAADHRPDVGPW